MKPSPVRPGSRGFTLLELIIVAAIVVFLLVMWLPTVNRPDRSPSVACLSNLRQVSIAAILWGDSHSNQLPWEVAPMAWDQPSPPGSLSPLPYFQSFFPYGLPPSVLRCPTDRQRSAATDSSKVSENNISYFLNVDSTLTNSPSTTVLAGDRHLMRAGQEISPGRFELTSDAELRWGTSLHKNFGLMGFADGHVENIRSERLAEVVGRQPLATNRLLVP